MVSQGLRPRPPRARRLTASNNQRRQNKRNLSTRPHRLIYRQRLLHLPLKHFGLRGGRALLKSSEGLVRLFCLGQLQGREIPTIGSGNRRQTALRTQDRRVLSVATNLDSDRIVRPHPARRAPTASSWLTRSTSVSNGSSVDAVPAPTKIASYSFRSS